MDTLGLHQYHLYQAARIVKQEGACSALALRPPTSLYPGRCEYPCQYPTQSPFRCPPQHSISLKPCYFEWLESLFIPVAPCGSSKPCGGCHKGVAVKMHIPHLVAHGTPRRAHRHLEQSGDGPVFPNTDHRKSSFLQGFIRILPMTEVIGRTRVFHCFCTCLFVSWYLPIQNSTA